MINNEIETTTGMKKHIPVIFTFILLSSVSLPSWPQTSAVSQPDALKYGALAIDRENGFFYAWAVDCTTLAEAQKKSVDECSKKGGKCTVVLSFSGSCCGAYRTSTGKNIGLAFGWGAAKTKEEADVIAKREHLLRSFGMAAPNVTYGCNSTKPGAFKIIYNASQEIESLPGEEEDY